MIEMPAVDGKKCNGCGLCVGICYCHTIVLVNSVATIIETEKCQWCTECEAVCPTGAISCLYQIIVEESQKH